MLQTKPWGLDVQDGTRSAVEMWRHPEGHKVAGSLLLELGRRHEAKSPGIVVWQEKASHLCRTDSLVLEYVPVVRTYMSRRAV